MPATVSRWKTDTDRTPAASTTTAPAVGRGSATGSVVANATAQTSRTYGPIAPVPAIRPATSATAAAPSSTAAATAAGAATLHRRRLQLLTPAIVAAAGRRVVPCAS